MKSRYLKHLRIQKRKWDRFGSWLGGKCPQCGEEKLFFYDKYDAICCVNCNVWFSKKCDVQHCPFCSSRPETPFEAFFYDEERNLMVKEWHRNNYQHKTSGQKKHEHKRDVYAQIIEYKKWR